MHGFSPPGPKKNPKKRTPEDPARAREGVKSRTARNSAAAPHTWCATRADSDTEAAVKRSRPTRLSSLIEQTLARIGLDRRLDDYRVWQAWDEVVGRTISRNAQPVRLDGTRLIVTVRSSTWLQELSLLQRELIARLNEWMGREVVGELFFVVGRVEQHIPDSLTRSRPQPRRLGEPQGRRLREESSSNEEAAPSSEDLSPDVAATFERLWRAARARGDQPKS
jgi:predicted nucleic acid-binding Zn ribbon protein